MEGFGLDFTFTWLMYYKLLKINKPNDYLKVYTQKSSEMSTLTHNDSTLHKQHIHNILFPQTLPYVQINTFT